MNGDKNNFYHLYALKKLVNDGRYADIKIYICYDWVTNKLKLKQVVFIIKSYFYYIPR